MKAVVYEALNSVRVELITLRDRYNDNENDLTEMTDRVQVALSLYSQQCDRRLQEREQELTVDHELEMTDIKKLMQTREEEICTIKRNLEEKETELAEHERLMTTMRQKLQEEQNELKSLQNLSYEQLEQARIDKEAALEKINNEKFNEIKSLMDTLTQCQRRVQELEENLSTARNDQTRMKEASDQFQLQYKTELETIRSRFKLMAASTATAASMEKSSSDSSLEKIEVILSVFS